VKPTRALSMSQRLSIRREVVEYGSLPVAAWLSQADGISAVRTLLVQLSERTADSGTGEYCPILLEHTLRLQMLISKSAGMVAGMISLPALAECLDVPEQHAEVWLPLAAVWNLSMTNSQARHHPDGRLGSNMTYT